MDGRTRVWGRGDGWTREREDARLGTRGRVEVRIGVWGRGTGRREVACLGTRDEGAETWGSLTNIVYRYYVAKYLGSFCSL